MKSSIFAPIAVASIASLTACGSLASHSDLETKSTLATVSGSITNPNSLPIEGDAFRVAVVWLPVNGPTPDGGAKQTDLLQSAQDIAVTPIFPVQFKLDLTDPPPSSALSVPYSTLPSPDANVQAAAGLVVAYEDHNHNGKLDQVGPGATAFIDRILAIYTLANSGSLSGLLYMQGSLGTNPSAFSQFEDSSGAFPNPGFNLMRAGCSDGATCGREFWTWVPASTPISLLVSADPTFQRLMCTVNVLDDTVIHNDTTHAPGDFPATFPAPTDPKLTCASDGRSYTDEACVHQAPAGVCDGGIVTCTGDTYRLIANAKAPSGWPCTVQ